MTQRGRGSGRPSSSPRRTGAVDRPRQGEGREVRPRGDLAARRVALRAVVEPVVRDAGYDLEDLTVSRAGRRHVVRVVVDGDGGVNLDAVAVVSRAVSAALDAAEETGGELLAGEYQLEVSSPGVDRPLTLPRHWRRNVGRLVRVGVDERQLTGRVVGADDGGIVLDVDGTAHELPYAGLGPGRVQIEFTRLEEIAESDLEEIPGDPDDDEADDEADDDEDVEGEER